MTHEFPDETFYGKIVPKKNEPGHTLITDKRESWDIFYGSVYSFKEFGGKIDSYQGAIQNLKKPDRIHQVSFRRLN